MDRSVHIQASLRLSSPAFDLRTLIIVVLWLLGTLNCDASTCPNCGNVSVPYPFSTSSTCGDPLYKVVCNSERKLSFNTSSGTYPVVSISPGTQRLVIGTPDISSTSCRTTDYPKGGLVLDSTGPFNITSSNTVFLLNCSSTLLYSPLNCSSNSLCHQYLTQDSEGAACRRSSLCCTFKAGGSSTSHTLRADDCTAYVSVLSPNPRNSASTWNYGIELEWTAPSEPLCTSQKNCSQNSTCSTDPALQRLSRCFCNRGFHWNTTSGLCTADIVGPCGDRVCIRHRNKAPIIGGVVAGVAGSFIGVFLISSYCQKKRRAREAKNKLSKERQQILSAGSGGKSAKLFTGHEMRRATRNFAKNRLLGSGGFGDVYKGVLDDGTVVAVKSAKLGNIKGVEQVLNEVRVLSQVNHRSLVGLLGCCVETQEPLLVYEYISNGTLLEHLKGARGLFLEWKTRLRIALQTAEGLAYLHSAATPPIIHRDVKSSNILLDDGLTARVSDFGLSRLAQEDLSHISTCAQGTLGYLDPEYYRNFQLTAKSDVYSFGIVLLELVTSQRAIEFRRGQDNVNLAVYVASMAEEGRLLEVMDPRLARRNDSTASHGTASDAGVEGEGGEATVVESMRRVAFLALSCLRDCRGDRPSMKEVAEELQYALNRVQSDGQTPTSPFALFGSAHETEPFSSSTTTTQPSSDWSMI